MTRSEKTPDTTRRGFLSVAAASITEAAGAGLALQGGESVGDPDLVVSLWRDWLTAHRMASDACRRQQKLETDMLRELGSVPRVEIVFPEDDGFIWAYTIDEIRRLLPNPEQGDTRWAAIAELSARQADWDAVDIHIGYSEAKKAEAETADIEDGLSEALWSSLPRSFAGLAAKLHCVLEMEDPGSGLQEAPWPQLRAILADLVQIAALGD